ncbi:MAG: polysaccharide biosynthesis tyrosine autokinase [Rhizonema sp. NSF051]|nr:polysaccharide biosynthesis tyrosine autokinase [Rhizonema sp. NSF051]
MADIGLYRGELVITSSKSAVDIRQISTILLRRRLQILGVSCAVLSVASLLASMAKPTYRSSMQILVSSHPIDNQVSVDSELTDSNTDVDYATQLKLMLSSSQMIHKAVDLLRSEYPDITVEEIKGKGKQGSLVVNLVQSHKGINKIPNQVFEVSFKDDDAVKTKKVLQVLQKVYRDYNIEQQRERISQGLAFVNEQLPKVKEQMDQAQKQLEQFRKRYNLLDPEVQGKMLLQSLADIKKQLQITRAQLQDVKARSNNIQQELALSSQKVLASSVNQSNRYQTLLGEIQKTEMALVQEQKRYTDDSPAVQKLIKQRQTQVALLREEVAEPQTDSVQLTPQVFLTSGSPNNFTAVVSSGLSTASSLNNLSQQTNVTTPLTQGQITGVDLKLVFELTKVQTAVLGLRANEKSLAESEQQIRSELSKYPSLIAKYNSLLPAVETNRKTLDQLMATQQSLGLKIAQTRFGWQMLEEPQSGVYVGSSRLLFLLGGAVIGPILGFAVALMWEMSHDAIYSARDIQRLTNLRLLGTVPKLPQCRPKKRVFGRRHQADSPDIYSCLPSDETLDIAYQNIQILKSSLPFKSLMLTSALAGEGKSTVALGFAVSATRMHQRVLLIDANLRSPHLHKILELSNDWGLSLLLIDEKNTPLQEYIQPIHPSLDVLTAGPISDDPIKLLSSGRMKELLELFEQTYDIVLIDAPAILDSVDARIVASVSNAIVMVGRMGLVTRTALAQSTETLNKLNLIGIVANETSNSTK